MLPVLQNWSCHNCGGCCREHQIAITEVEKRRIETMKWTDDAPASDRPHIVPMGPGWRLNHQPDGACVFLNERGLCRIHAVHGEAAKPLACQVYPYAVHPAGAAVTTSLRFSCPSVVQNLGQPVAQQRAFIESLAKQIVPANYKAPAAPDFFAGQKLEWPDFTRIQAFLERGLADPRVGFATRLMRVLSWLDLAEKAQSEVLKGDRLGELLTLLHDASVRAQPDDDLPVTKPSALGRLMFRQLIAQLLRHDTDVTARKGIGARLRLLGEGLRFTIGAGRVPVLADPISVAVAFGGTGSAGVQNLLPRFGQLEREFGGRNAEFNELFTRYFRVKVQGIHFCGRAYYDTSVIDGFRSLALMYPATLWVARLRAAREGRTKLELRDVQAALATLDHNFGYSPALGLRSSHQRITQLAAMQQITALCGWYSL
jgi:lysine-N-methylase